MVGGNAFRFKQMQGSHCGNKNNLNLWVLFSNALSDGKEAREMPQADAVGGKEHNTALRILNRTTAVDLVGWSPPKSFQAVHKTKPEQPKRKDEGEGGKSKTLGNDLSAAKRKGIADSVEFTGGFFTTDVQEVLL